MTRSRVIRVLIGLAASREGLAAVAALGRAWRGEVPPAALPPPPRPRGQELAPWVRLADHDEAVKASAAHEEWRRQEAAGAGLAFGGDDSTWPKVRRARVNHLRMLIRRAVAAGQEPDFEQLAVIVGIPANDCRALVEES